MKVICNGNDLAVAVSQVFKATGSKLSQPILEGILLKAEKNSLTLTATDLELAIEKSIKADVKIEGEAVVPGRFFSDFVKKLSFERIELSSSSVASGLKIKYGDSEGVLQTFDAAEFPPIKELIDAESFTIPKKELKELINKVVFSVALDDARPILKGVLIELSEDSVCAVALDGYRLAKCEKKLLKGSAELSVVVPARCLNEVSRLLSDTDEPIQVFIQRNYLMINIDEARITTRLLNGDFINYKNIIPKDSDTSVIVPKEPFESGLERAMLLAKSEKTNLVKFDIKSDLLTLSSNSEIGNLNEKVPVKATGMDLAIAFNARYFSDILKAVSTDHIMLKLTTASAPCVVTSVTSNSDFLYLVLPVRISS